MPEIPRQKDARGVFGVGEEAQQFVFAPGRGEREEGADLGVGGDEDGGEVC